MTEDICILICGDQVNEANEKLTGKKALEAECEDCKMKVFYTPDPEVPDDHVKVCFSCGIARMQKQKEAGEPPLVSITKQNKSLLDRLGFKLRTEGSA